MGEHAETSETRDRSRRTAGEAASAELDRRLGALATSQSGVATRGQLVALGFSTAWVDAQVDRRLWRVGPGIYSVGHRALSRRGKGVAALLHAGKDAGLSEVSAGRVWGTIENPGDGDIHVSVSTRSDIAKMDGVVIHRPRNLLPEEIVEHRGLRLTTPERTLQDLLRSSSEAEVTRMLEQMVTRLGRSPDDLHAWGHALGRIDGKRKLIRALDNVAGPAVIRSEFESLFRSVCQEGGLPPAQTNARIGPWEVDAVYFEERVAIELDSYRWHGGRWQFHRDRRKGLAVSKAGFELLRISWPQLKNERADVIEAIAYALHRGRARQAARAT